MARFSLACLSLLLVLLVLSVSASDAAEAPLGSSDLDEARGEEADEGGEVVRAE